MKRPTLMLRPFIPALALAAICATLNAAPVFEQTPLWTAGQDGYHTYRIPSLLVSAKGTVLAFCEGRKTGGGDHGDLDLIMKRSTDGGRTWSPHAIVHEEGGEAKITIGNPCPVVDAKSGAIVLPFTRDNKAVFVTTSTDDGQTWSTPRDISGATMKPDWVWVATGPGVGIQLTKGAHKGRLVIPSDHRRNVDGQAEWNSHMMISDDGGATWQISTPIQAGGNECQVVERADGSLLVNTRMQGHFQGYRGIATSSDGGATWSAITQETQLRCPKCQGSFVRQDEKRVLFSNPHPRAPVEDEKGRGVRERLTVRASTDDGKSWPVARVVHEGPSAYSALARLADGTILCLYEGGEKGAYRELRLARFNLEWLSGGKDVY
jgi:sialidase-1